MKYEMGIRGTDLKPTIELESTDEAYEAKEMNHF